MTQTLIFTPADPASVTEVTRLRLWDNPTRTDPPTEDNSSPVELANGSWSFTFPDPTPGTYYSRVDLSYVDTTTGAIDDVVTLPLPVPQQGGAEIAPWVTRAQLTDAGSATNAQKDSACQVATEVLYALSGRRWPGPRSDRLLIRPQAPDVRVARPSSFPWSAPRMATVCGCHTSELDPQLPGPITRVVRMTVAGTDVPVDQVEVIDRRVIRVVPGPDATTDPLAVNRWQTVDGFYSLFPAPEVCCGRMATVELVVEWGCLPPQAGVNAAVSLATEIAKGLAGDSCKLAGNVTSIDRQGVSVLLDPSTFLDHGRTGEPVADLWLSTVNPKALRRAPEVWWPEGGEVARLS